MAVSILLLRSGDEPDPYEEILGKKGYEVTCLPVLAFETVNDENLRRALEHPSRFGGLVFTSPRAVDAFGEAMPWLPTENVLWHNKPVFAVGPRTADELRRIGFSPIGEESGSAEGLADVIRKERIDAPLLYLCGDRRREVLPDLLEAAGIDVEEICVYKTTLRTALEWPAEKHPDWIVFFSPSGVEAIRQSGLSVEGRRLAAIGPTTAREIEAHGLRVDAVADDPTPEGLILAIGRAGDG